MKPLILPFLSVFFLASCSTIFTEKTQNIAINTAPSGATCTLTRMNETIAVIENTPQITTITRSEHDVTVRCSKEGYQDAVAINNSQSQAPSLGDVILGGGLVWAVDSARGTGNDYQDNIHITLQKL